MALNYCEVCGVLISSAPQSAPASICERCFASRKVLIAPDPPSDDERTDSRVQFSCPGCGSILQLPPVKKRTRIKCPRCRADFSMTPEGKIERAGGTTKIAQERLLGDLKPRRELDDLLARVPEKKGQALPSVLDSGQYADFKVDSGSASAQPEVELDMLPQGVGPGEAAQSHEQGYVLLPEPKAPVDFPESKELDPVADEPEVKKVKRKTTARRSREHVEKERKEREARSQRAQEAAKYTLAIMEQRRRRAFATARLVGLVVSPLLAGGLLLVSTTQEAGFAVHGLLGRTLTEAGKTAIRGVEGVRSLAGASR